MVKKKDINLINGINTAIEEIRRTKPIIELVVRNWNTEDVKYWVSLVLKLKTLISILYILLNSIILIEM